MQLDDLDQRILDLLGKDGRASHAAIGRELGMTGPAVYARVSRLEQAGLIRGYAARIDPRATGRQLLAFIRVSTRAHAEENTAFEAFVHEEERVVECHDVDGEDSYILKVRCASTEDLRSLIVVIRSLPQVIRTVTSIALKSMKDPEASPQ
ncbi:MAG TPA: Lrp/AsnC family transcriptional regulator [Fimbriimonadaceae bacterium]|nr:Lrp/AsnC family transcriptional regulator [Fimbriimonadaceae bacterium]